MRHSIALVLVIAAVAACGKSSKTPGGDDDDGMPDASGPLGTPAFSIVTPDITLTPGEEVTYCYYFHTTNTTDIAVNKWTSLMNVGSHHLILFLGGDAHADGLDTTNSCGLGTGGSIQNSPVWVYASQVVGSEQELDLPADDGNGKPLAEKIPANSEAALQMHYLNSSDNTETAHDELAAYALPSGAAYTETDAYITYNQDINIPANATNVTVTASCPVPSGVKFWEMSTHSHKQSVTTTVSDGSSAIVQSSDWEHPTVQIWGTTPFYTFTNSNLTWSCNYNNNAPPPYEPNGTSNADTTVVAGPSAATNEMCMAVGYFFPATGPEFHLEYGGTCLGL
ncbi:MAG TPA: hypothetical protein VLX92_32370 [Kofleriaceae bacterium]|nr:hypothetical protein [Kofleriaceae bacterium]